MPGELVFKHQKQLQMADGPDTSRVRPSDWGATHAPTILNGSPEDGDAVIYKGSATQKFILAPLIPAGTRMLFDQDASPSGWVRDTDAPLNDRLIRTVTGARTPNGGSWVIAGLSTDVQGAHGHSFTTGGPSGAQIVEGGAGPNVATDGHFHSGATNTTGGHGHNVTSNGGWRPAHRDMIVCVKSAY